MHLENYLEIAEAVLKTARRPMTPRAIMESAHRGGIVPSHLYGKTQHKTLHARLSEDILRNKLESRFFRTAPGFFFLSELRSDPTIDESFKDPFHARRRARDLAKSCALAFDSSFLEARRSEASNWQELFEAADEAGALKHVDPKTVDSSLALVWAFSIVRRRHQILSYRIGRYRDQRDAFANRKSIGFTDMVGFNDLTLFSEDMGVAECGLNAVFSDLDLSRSAFSSKVVPPSISCAVINTHSSPEPVALFVVEWNCPDWFEPTARRLSLNEVHWIDATHKPNDIEDFEPWSALAFDVIVGRAARNCTNGEEDKCAAGSVFTF